MGGILKSHLMQGSAITLAAMLLPAQAAAQPQSSPSQEEDAPSRREIVVTAIPQDDSYAPQQAAVAGKAPAPLLEIPQSVSVVTQQQIQDRNLFTIGEAVQTVAGVTVMPFDGSDPDYRARGFVLDYAYDGIPSTFSSGVPEFQLVIYERLEVQRGPTGLFRGSGSPGGTINLIRKRGGDDFSFSSALSAGSWSNYRGELDIGGPIGAAGRLRFRGVAALVDRRFSQDKSHTRNITAYGAVDFDLTATTRLGASVTYQDEAVNVAPTGQPAFSNQQFLNFPRNFQHLPSWNRNDETIVEYAAEAEQQFGDWRFVARALHRDIPRLFEDAFIAPNTGVNPTTLTATYVRRFTQGENGKTALDAFATGPFRLFGREHDLTMGYSLDRRTTSFRSIPTQTAGVFSIFNPDIIRRPTGTFTTGSETDLRQSGFHAQVRLRPFGPLTIVAGARISDYTNRSRNIAPSVPTNWLPGARERGVFTPSIGAVLYLTGDITAYASYSDIFNPQTAQRADGTVLDPRIGEQYEAGLKGRFLDGHLNAAAAVFRSRDINRALADANAPGFFVPAGVVSIKGFEFEVAGRPIRGLDLIASYTNVKTQFEVGTAAQTGNVFDNFTPRHQYKFYARYEPAAHGGAFASLGLNGQSSVVGGGVGGVREQGPFAVASAQLGYRFNANLRAFLSVNNLFDKVYYVRVGSINTYNTFGDPRNLLITMRANF